MPRVYPSKVVKILMSDRQGCYIEIISEVVHRAAGLNVKVVAFTPATADADDLIRTASRQKWDIGFLFLNNIDYSSGNRSSRAIASDSIDFLMKMVIVFDKPIFALHGLNEGGWYEARLREAGAAAVYHVPFSLDDMVPAVRKYSGIW